MFMAANESTAKISNDFFRVYIQYTLYIYICMCNVYGWHCMPPFAIIRFLPACCAMKFAYFIRLPIIWKVYIIWVLAFPGSRAYVSVNQRRKPLKINFFTIHRVHIKSRVLSHRIDFALWILTQKEFFTPQTADRVSECFTNGTIFCLVLPNTHTHIYHNLSIVG